MLKKKMHADFKNLRNQIIYFAHKSRSYFKTATYFENEKITLQLSMKVLSN